MLKTGLFYQLPCLTLTRLFQRAENEGYLPFVDSLSVLFLIFLLALIFFFVLSPSWLLLILFCMVLFVFVFMSCLFMSCLSFPVATTSVTFSKFLHITKKREALEKLSFWSYSLSMSLFVSVIRFFFFCLRREWWGGRFRLHLR
jgi:hypothetical protein